jgi:co-chaperonin GroES (HSP10)
MNNGGDVLARGGATAQFAGASSNITDFENDFIYMTVEEILSKYGLSQAEYDEYARLRDVDGEHLPDLTPVALQETLEVGFSVTDSRRNYLSESTSSPAVVTEAPKKYPEPEYQQAHPILDRVLVMIVADDPDTEILEDGSSRNKKSGLITAAKYRQHSNVGIVLAAGQYVVLSGMRFNMSEFVQAGDKITYGDYNSEIFPMDKKKIEALCDSLQVNYVEDPKGLRVVRVQDIRVVENKVRPVYVDAESFGNASGSFKLGPWQDNLIITTNREVPNV